VTTTSLSFLEVLWIAHSLLFELSCQLMSRVQPGPMTCVSCLIGVRYVEPLSSSSLSLLFVAFSTRRTSSIPASQGGVPYRAPLKRNVPVVESCFSVGLILQPPEGWIATSSMLTPPQTNRPKRALTSMCMEVTYMCRLLGLSLLLALADFAYTQRSRCRNCYKCYLNCFQFLFHSELNVM